MTTQTLPLHLHFNSLVQQQSVYRYKQPGTIAYKKLEFYSHGLLKERISKMIIAKFEGASAYSLSKLREKIFSSRIEVSQMINIDSNGFDVLLAECLLLNGFPKIFGERILTVLFSLGLQKYMIEVNQRKLHWQNDNRPAYFDKFVEVPCVENDVIPRVPCIYSSESRSFN